MRTNELRIGEMMPSGLPDTNQLHDIRRTIRYPLRVPVAFSWIDRDGLRHEGKGHSRDIDECGAYILAKTSPPAGVNVSLVISFPYLQEATRASCMVMGGRVARVELLLAGKMNWGFAVSATHAVLNEFDDPDGGLDDD